MRNTAAAATGFGTSFLVLLLWGAPAPRAAAAAPAPLRVLLFSGQNNHDWKTTTPRLQSILTNSGRFTVEVVDRPDRCAASTFARSDVIVCNWNAWGNAPVKDWPAATREAFLNFIRDGGGHVVIHAGGSSFYDWPEYQQIAGASWNLPKTGHGAPHEFTVQSDAGHPVTRGLAPFRTKDELWLQPGVHPTAKVIATADGQPLAMTTAFGQGRSFALLLGHAAEFMNTAGFQSLLLRGTEWAASGKVTLPALGDARAPDPDEVIKSVAAYHFGDPRPAVLALEKLVFAASTDPAEKKSLAVKLAHALGAEGTADAKRHFCQGLSLVGSAAEVPALVKALSDPNLFDHVRQALERIPGDEATAALQSALAAASGSARASLIGSLAARRAESALPDIAKLITDTDRQVAGAAIEALGKLGTGPAAVALQGAEKEIPAELRERFAVARLRCAESLRAAGQTAPASALFETLAASDQPACVRVAAFPLHIAALGDRGGDKVVAALTGDEPAMRSAALRALRFARRPALLRAAVEKLEQLPAELREALLALCAEQGDASLLPAVTKAASSADPAVKLAAIRALGLLGDKSAVPPLVKLMDSASDDEQKALAQALTRLRGGGVEAAMTDALKSVAAPVQQRTLIRALAARDARGATPAFLLALASADAGVRREALGALGKTADASACGPMMKFLDQADGNDKSAMEPALVEICRRDNTAAGAFGAELPRLSPAAQTVVLGVLGSAGGAPALDAVRSQLASSHAAVRLAAVRVLADWPDAAPLDDLASLVETTGDARLRALAVRGLNRMAPQAPARATRAALALARALAASTDTGDQKSYLAALAGVPSVPSLQAAQSLLKHPALGGEAAAALLNVAEVVYPWHQAEVKAALAELKSAPTAPALQPRAAALAAKLDAPANLAVGGLATSPDGVEKDGASSGDQAAIDGDPKTYWDEDDNQKLYRLRIQLRERSTVGCLRILGFQQHSYAPKDFEVLCDNKMVKRITGAQYKNNWLSVEFPPVQCEAVELKITGYYSQSPAIRELEIYSKAPITLRE